MPFFTQPPDPNPKTPKLKLPYGAIDCHVHLFGPASKYPFHSGSRYVSNDALPETHIALQDTLGLSGAVVVSGGGYGRNTTHLEDALRVFPDRFRGVALLPENVTRADIERLHALGVRGARFVSAGHGGALPRLPDLTPKLASWLHEFGWHVQFYPAQGDLVDHADALLAQPNPIVLDHFACLDAAGGVEQRAFKDLLKLIDTGRVWLKLSGPMRCTKQDLPYASVTPIAHALVHHAPERLLWGSDWPHVNMNDRAMPNDGDLVDLIGQWMGNPKIMQQILADNPRVVYDFVTA
jgi:2-pyrone-4,6-dicarboxylate lactonase